jgi:hypothetical protein
MCLRCWAALWQAARVDDDDMTMQMVVQLPMGISDDDLGVRHRLEAELDRAFDAKKIGLVDGGDIGSGTMNVFALVRAGSWNAALLTAVSVLRELSIEKSAVVAQRDLTDDDSEPMIIWPEGSEAPFEY